MAFDISGRWIFSEEFDFGTDKGFAVLKQDGETVSGFFEYEESIEDEEPFMIRQYYNGIVEGNKITFIGERTTDLDGVSFTNYNLDTLEGIYTCEGKIVGHSYDCEDFCGVFVLTRDCSTSD